MVVYFVLGKNNVQWALTKKVTKPTLYVNSLGPSMLIEVASRLNISDACSKLIDYQQVWYIEEIHTLLGDRDTLIIENVSQLLAQMPHTSVQLQSQSFVRLLVHCRIRDLTLVLLEPTHNLFFSNLLDEDIEA